MAVATIYSPSRWAKTRLFFESLAPEAYAMCNFLEPPTLREASYTPTPLLRSSELPLSCTSRRLSKNNLYFTQLKIAVGYF